MQQVEIKLLNEFSPQERERLSRLISEKVDELGWEVRSIALSGLRQPNRVVFCAVSGEKLLGFASATKSGSKLMINQRWATTPKSLIKGVENPSTIGRMLTRRLEDFSKSEKLNLTLGVATRVGSKFRRRLRKPLLAFSQ